MGKSPRTKPKKKHIEWRRVVTIALAALLALALVLPLISSVFTSAHALTQAELEQQIQQLKDDAQESAARKKELEQELSAIQSDKSQAMARKQVLDQQLAALEEQISNTQSQIDTYTALIAEEEIALADAQAAEESAYETFCKRARSMEEAGTLSYWSVLFQAGSFSDLLDRLALVDQIMEYDNSVVEALAAARAQVEDTLAALNETKAGLDEQKAALDVQRAEQSDKVAEAQANLDELKAQEDQWEALVAAEEAEQARLDQEQAKKEKELQKLIESQKIKFTTGSGYAYPLPSGNTIITSKFGPRTHPITGKYNNHTGIDIAAPAMTPIYAVQGGVVQTSSYAPSSYGEYVVINHGNGITTLYAHMTRGTRQVKEGDIVTQGQVIGYVGMTGSASGNHLHLEYRVNGVRQNPLQLFPAVNFTFW